MRRDLNFEIVYPNPPGEVWRALTDPESLADWLMENDFAPRVGHKFQFRTKTGLGLNRIIECEALEVDDLRTLSYRWGVEGSVVTFRLDSTAKGTRLRLEHKGFRGVRGRALAWVLSKGWDRKIHQRLPAILVGTGMQSDREKGERP